MTSRCSIWGGDGAPAGGERCAIPAILLPALARSYPGMDAVRDLGGIRGDAFLPLIHAHSE
jgi:hypothetical protein